MAGLKKVQLEELLDHFLRRFYRWPGSEKLSKKELLRIASRAIEDQGRHAEPVVLWADGDTRGRIKKRKSLFPKGPIGNIDFDSLEARAYRGRHIRILYAPKDILDSLADDYEYHELLFKYYMRGFSELNLNDKVEIRFDRVAALADFVVDGIQVDAEFCLEFAKAANSCSWLRHEVWVSIMHQLLMIERFCKKAGITKADINCWNLLSEEGVCSGLMKPDTHLGDNARH